MPKVLVTGASGFIAKHIVRELLAKGYAVRASVRSDRGRSQVADLFGEDAVEFVTLDLTKDEGWAEAMQGVDVLMHTASPFPAQDPKDPQELIRPAVDGTLRALRAAQGAGVTRVILTSSCAAIYKDSSKPLDQPSTRDNWTDPDASTTTTYEASKTLAERAAWDFVAEHPEMKLTVINPGGVFGQPMDEHYGTSLDYVNQVLTTKSPAWPRVGVPVVDVRDVATMHVAAINNDETIGERFPATAGAMTLVELAKVLAKAFPEQKIATRAMPDFLVKAIGKLVPQMRPLAAMIGRNIEVIGTDGPEVMGFSYTSPEDAAVASAQWLLDHAK